MTPANTVIRPNVQKTTLAVVSVRVRTRKGSVGRLSVTSVKVAD